VNDVHTTASYYLDGHENVSQKISDFMLWNISHGLPDSLWQPSTWQHSNRMETIIHCKNDHCKRTALKSRSAQKPKYNVPQHQRTAAAALRERKGYGLLRKRLLQLATKLELVDQQTS